MKTIRQLHLWLGVLFAPAIFFFALTGGLQILGLHEGRDASPVIARLALVHKDQRFEQGERRGPRPPRADANPAAGGPDHDGPPGEPPGGPASSRPAPPPRSILLVVFFLAMSLGLMVSTVLGVYMAFAYRRDRRVIIGLLAAGVALPVIGLFL